MNYNDGYSHKIDKLLIEEKKEAATAFSEGNPLLRDCLLLLWEHNITTYACCNGHDYPQNIQNSFYLAMEVDEFSEKLIKKFCNWVQKLNTDYIKLNFLSNNNHDFGFCMYLRKSIRDSVLNFIVKSIEDDKLNIDKDYNENSDYYLYGMLLRKFAIQNNASMSYDISNDNNMMFNVCPNGTLVPVEPLNLEDCLNEIATTGRFSSVPYKCNIKSLKDFLELIYPNLESYYMNNYSMTAQNNSNNFQNNNSMSNEQIAQFSSLGLCDDDGCLTRADSKIIMLIRGKQLPPGRVLLIYELSPEELKILWEHVMKRETRNMDNKK